MSMLSAQIDRLRRHADLYDGTTKPEMAKELQRPYLAQELRDAADTIWQLRDDLQQANAENARLREQIYWLKQGDILHVLTDQEYIDQCERERLMQVSIDALDKENAKLRELVRIAVQYCDSGTCDWCPIHGENGSCPYSDMARELGVEVDDG